MEEYLMVGATILNSGKAKGDRTGTGTRSMRSARVAFDLMNGFPLLTTKLVRLDKVFTELKWMLLGLSDNRWLVEHGCGIWSPWAVKEDVYKTTDLLPYERLELALRTLAGDDMDKFTKGWVDGRYNANPDVDEGMRYIDTFGVPRTKDVVMAKAGDLNAPYGPSWRAFGNKRIDQIATMVELLKTNPDSRRMVVSSWDAGNLPDDTLTPSENIVAGNPCLPPCHWAHELYTEKMTLAERIGWHAANSCTDASERAALIEHLTKLYADGDCVSVMLDDQGVPDRYLDLVFHMRSSDWFLGAPYNIASYGMLLMMYAKTVNMVPRWLEYQGVNVHLYNDHIQAFAEQFSRTPRARPTLLLNTRHDKLEDYVFEDFELIGYNPYPAIKATPSV